MKESAFGLTLGPRNTGCRLSERMFRVAVLAVIGMGASAQVRPQNGDLFFDAVDVNVVNIEVLVTDKSGVPVTGLSREDFVVFEDGREVELSNFFEVVEGRAVAASTGPDDPPPVPETERLQLVVFIDNANLGPHSRRRIFADLRQYLSQRLTPDDRVMLVVANDSVEIAQPFTNDPVKLLAEVKRLEKQLGKQAQLDIEYRTLMRGIQQASLASPAQSQSESQFFFDSAVREAATLAREVGRLAERRFRQVQATTAALERFTDTLAGMKGRKGVVYVSDGLPVRAADSLVEAWIGKYENWILQTGESELTRELTSLTSLDFDASRELSRLVTRANANRVAFYPISAPARGVGSTISAEVPGGAMSGGGAPVALGVTNVENFSREDSLLRLADGTGGRAFTRSTNISGLLAQMKSDFSTFYSLGYQRGPAELDEEKQHSEHRIRVEVRDGDLEVRYLKSYREKTPIDLLEDRTLTAMHYSIVDNPLGVRLVPGKPVATGRNRYEVPVMVQVPFQRLLLLPQNESHTAQVTILVAARDERGGVSPFQRIEVPIRIPNEQFAEAMRGAAGYAMNLAMKGGKQRISVGVRDHLAQVDSTLNLELLVGGPEESSPAESS